MNVLPDYFEDSLEPLGLGAGAFLVLAALGTIAGAPWTVLPNVATAALQLVGAVLMAIVGLGLLYLSWQPNT